MIKKRISALISLMMILNIALPSLGEYYQGLSNHSYITAKAIDTSNYKSNYGFTYEDLFKKYPYYLYNDVSNKVTDKSKETYKDVISSFSNTDNSILAYIEGLNNGTSIIINELLATCGIGDTAKMQKLDKATTTLIYELSQNEELLKVVTSAVDDAFENYDDLKKIYKGANNIMDSTLIEALRESTKHYSEKEIKDVLKKYDDYKKAGKLSFDTIDCAVDALDISMAAIQAEEVEFELLYQLKKKIKIY